MSEEADKLFKELIDNRMDTFKSFLKLYTDLSKWKLCTTCGVLAAPRKTLCYHCNAGINPDEHRLRQGKKQIAQKIFAANRVTDLKAKIAQLKKTNLYKRIYKRKC